MPRLALLLTLPLLAACRSNPPDNHFPREMKVGYPRPYIRGSLRIEITGIAESRFGIVDVVGAASNRGKRAVRGLVVPIRFLDEKGREIAVATARCGNILPGEALQFRTPLVGPPPTRAIGRVVWGEITRR